MLLTTGYSYNTIETASQGLFKDKGSKFLAFAYPVKNEDEAKVHIEVLKKEYFDARHHCYAYALGANREQYRAFDDGEPSGTAGKPILGQITSFNLSNIVIVVVRYFGGTLLGTGGLIQAYKNAAADALHNTKIVEKTVDAIYQIAFEYLVMNQVMRVLKEYNVELFNMQSDNSCCASIAIHKSDIEMVSLQLLKIGSVRLEFLCFR